MCHVNVCNMNVIICRHSLASALRRMVMRIKTSFYPRSRLAISRRHWCPAATRRVTHCLLVNRPAVSRRHRRPAATRRVTHCLLVNQPAISRRHRRPAVMRRVTHCLLHNRPAAGRRHRPPLVTKRRRSPTSLWLHHLLLNLRRMQLMTPSPQQVPVPG